MRWRKSECESKSEAKGRRQVCQVLIPLQQQHLPPSCPHGSLTCMTDEPLYHRSFSLTSPFLHSSQHRERARECEGFALCLLFSSFLVFFLLFAWKRQVKISFGFCLGGNFDFESSPLVTPATANKPSPSPHHIISPHQCLGPLFWFWSLLHALQAARVLCVLCCVLCCVFCCVRDGRKQWFAAAAAWVLGQPHGLHQLV